MFLQSYELTDSNSAGLWRTMWTSNNAPLKSIKRAENGVALVKAIGAVGAFELLGDDAFLDGVVFARSIFDRA